MTSCRWQLSNIGDNNINLLLCAIWTYHRAVDVYLCTQWHLYRIQTQRLHNNAHRHFTSRIQIFHFISNDFNYKLFMFRKKMNVLKIEFECFFLFEKRTNFCRFKQIFHRYWLWFIRQKLISGNTRCINCFSANFMFCRIFTVIENTQMYRRHYISFVWFIRSQLKDFYLFIRRNTSFCKKFQAN